MSARCTEMRLRTRMLALLAAGVCWLMLPTWSVASRTLVIERFDGDLSDWQVEEFSGRTEYTLVSDEQGDRVLAAHSRGTASGLVKRISFDPRELPRLSWRWKIAATLPAGDARSREGDDYAARVYVIFPHWIKPLTRSINYIWANRLPRGSALPNTYYSRAMMLAVESGDARAGRWIREERNLVADYRRLFGEDPPMAGAVAIMTDSDNTGGAARAWYDDLVLSTGAE